MSTRLNKYLSITTCLFFFFMMGCTTKHQGLDRLDTNERGEPHNASTYDAGLDTFDDENLKQTGNIKGLEKPRWEQHHFGVNGAINVRLSGSSNRAVTYPTAQKPGYNMYNQRAQDSDDDDDDDDDDDYRYHDDRDDYDDDHDDDDHDHYDDHDDDHYDDHDDDHDDDHHHGQGNRAPVTVGSIPNQTVNVRANVTVNIGGYFSDRDGDALTYAATSSNTTKATVRASSATLTINGIAVGTATITVTATDPGNLTAIQTFTVTVNAQGNRAPTTVGTIPNQTVTVGANITVSLGGYFSDPDGDTLTYTATSSDTTRATVSVSGATLTITGVALTASGPMRTTITVTATDPGGLTATQTFTVTVNSTSSTSSEKQASLRADVNDDGVVDIVDMLLVAVQLGVSGVTNADINTDGIVDVQDLILVATAFSGVASAPAADGTLTVAQVQHWLDLAEQKLSLPTQGSVGGRESAYNRGIQVLKQMLRELLPQTTALLPNYPNPFNPETWIPYRLANASHVQISIYDASGHLVRLLALGHQAAGYYTSKSRAAYWDGRDSLGQIVGSGLYFYQLQAGSESFVRKMLILK